MAGHSHSCGQESHEHDHDDAERGREFSLYLKIDTENVECLNESVEGSGKAVFKPWEDKLDTKKFVESDVDEELLFNIPFTGNVKLKGLIVIGGEGDSHPSQMKLYKNRPRMTFDDTGVPPEQEFDLQPDNKGQLEYATKIVKFSSVQHLSIYFPKNFGADETIVYYIGLRGEFTEAKRHEVTICTYEARANPSDHKTNAFDSVGHQIQ
ncbi:PITH domain-containing protein GA19395-like [Lineus longissimus]|uniref:PITH domain-containing protein GA19395-like n=1 Tax=Lineus longissimus TaxID=88925 RepID=UPI002B4CA603